MRCPKSFNRILESPGQADDELLNDLAEFIHKPSILKIEGSIITAIPDKWRSSLKSIDCFGCSELVNLDAPKAESVSCRLCTNLRTIEAPKTKKIECTQCWNLRSVTISKDCKILGVLPSHMINYVEAE